MKRIILILCGLIFCIALFMLLLNFCINHDINESQYWFGRDTYLYLGNGRFQILETNDYYFITDEESSLPIENKIYRYYNDKENKILYSEGECGYTVINYETEEVQQYRELLEYDSNIQDIFNKKSFIKLIENSIKE